NISELDAVGFEEGPLQNRLGNLEPDEVVVCVGRIAVLGDLHDIKTKLGSNVGLWTLRVSNDRTVFGPQFGEFLGNGRIHSGVAGDVRSVVGQGAQREG